MSVIYGWARAKLTSKLKGPYWIRLGIKRDGPCYFRKGIESKPIRFKQAGSYRSTGLFYFFNLASISCCRMVRKLNRDCPSDLPSPFIWMKISTQILSLYLPVSFVEEEDRDSQVGFFLTQIWSDSATECYSLSSQSRKHVFFFFDLLCWRTYSLWDYNAIRSFSKSIILITLFS